MKNKKFLSLRSIRIKCEVTQQELGKQIGVKHSTYGCKENGSIPFTIEECFIITKFLNKILVKNGFNEVTLVELFSR